MGFIWGLLGAVALGIPGAGLAQNTLLTATVGPGSTISLTNASGARVTHLDRGTYDLTVRDLSELHSFHLKGPGVDRFTSIETTGTVTWTVTVTDGAYSYYCDAHPTTMRGTFTAGTATAPPPPPPPRLIATVGPGMTISLRTVAGRVVRTVHPGTYRVVVRDRSRVHNFHLLGIGLNRRTTPAFLGTVTWTVRFVAGRTYRFRCDTHPIRLRGSFRASA